MTRYVIGPDVAIRLAQDQAVIRGGHQILAPALLRSQVLSLLYQAVRRGEMTRTEAERQLEYVRGLRIRLRCTDLSGPCERHCHADLPADVQRGCAACRSTGAAACSCGRADRGRSRHGHCPGQ
jgi:hypothetical protein